MKTDTAERSAAVGRPCLGLLLVPPRHPETGAPLCAEVTPGDALPEPYVASVKASRGREAAMPMRPDSPKGQFFYALALAALIGALVAGIGR
ncbi:hypothetical protein [Streptomyces sp. NPDC004629]|uniref:hypothetical protein n=1 Tax=Streptomyces sp. NPDC004629 TaxID=3364705 RepID=UPI003690DBFD